MNTRTWTRREFSQALALSAAGAALVRPAAGSAPRTGLAVVGSRAAEHSEGALHVFRTAGDRWRLLQTVTAASPAHLLEHPTLPVLYVVHDVAEWNHQPRGAVSTYAVDRLSGRLTLLGTQPLSLSATHPRHAVLTAGGSHLFVAAEHGGIYNLLPVGADGNLLPVSGIRKEFGRQDGEEGKTAQPRGVALHPDGSLLTIDAGQESLSRFDLAEAGVALRRRDRIHAGSGPSSLALSTAGSHAYTLNADTGELAIHPLDGTSGPLGHARVPAGAHSLTVAPDGGFVLAVGDSSATVLRADRQTGHLSLHGRLDGMGSKPLFSHVEGELFGLDNASGSVRRTIFDTARGTAGASARVARVAGCASLLCLRAQDPEQA